MEPEIPRYSELRDRIMNTLAHHVQEEKNMQDPAYRAAQGDMERAFGQKTGYEDALKGYKESTKVKAAQPSADSDGLSEPDKPTEEPARKDRS